jgi:hypothetical protein
VAATNVGRQRYRAGHRSYDGSDVGDFFLRLPSADYTPTWYTQRIGGALGTQEQKAANRAAAHANTPAVMYMDSLGRTFLTILDDAAGGKFHARFELDISGNQVAIIDALDRTVVTVTYDVLKNRIAQASMDAGQSWMLNASTGSAIRAWDSRGHNLRTPYDAMRRPVGLFVQGTDPANSDPRTLAAEMQYEKLVYGEGQPNNTTLKSAQPRVPAFRPLRPTHLHGGQSHDRDQ